MTVLSCIARPDFVNLSVGVIAALMLLNTRILKRYMFRYFVAIMFLAFIYDMVWIFAMWDAYENGREELGSMKYEKSIKQFSITVSLVSFMLRLILIFLFWRASLDFRAIVKQKE